MWIRAGQYSSNQVLQRYTSALKNFFDTRTSSTFSKCQELSASTFWGHACITDTPWESWHVLFLFYMIVCLNLPKCLLKWGFIFLNVRASSYIFNGKNGRIIDKDYVLRKHLRPCTTRPQSVLKTVINFFTQGFACMVIVERSIVKRIAEKVMRKLLCISFF